MEIFKEIFFKPLYNLLIFLYNAIPSHDFGVAIILLTLIIKFILIPSSKSAIESQKAITDLQPKIKEVQQKYKDNKEKQAQTLIELYKEHKINPFSGFLNLIVQIPILIALYQVFWEGLNPKNLSSLYSFIANPGQIDPLFLGLLDLSKSSIFLAILAGLLQFVQTKMMSQPIIKNPQKDDFMSLFNQQMIYMMPFMTILIGLKLPAGLSLYWTTITLFAIIQQYLILKNKNNERVIKTNN